MIVERTPEPTLGILVLLGGFAAGLGGIAAVAAAFQYLITTRSILAGWSADWPVFAIIAGILGLSSVAGASWQLSWLRSHWSGAARAGMVSGAFSATVLASLAALSAWLPQTETAAIMTGRLFAVVGPGIAVALVTSSIRRKHLGAPDA
jgi:hypothetical protein